MIGGGAGLTSEGHVTEGATAHPGGEHGALMEALASYRRARQEFLELLGCSVSNRDPLAEFAERLAQVLLGGTLARSRVQKGYDLVTPSGQFVQVRYLANPSGEWVNGHLVDFRGGCDRYALLVVEDLDAKCLLAFTHDTLAAVCAALKKRHPNQETTLQLTQANYRTLLGEPERFATLSVDVFRLSA